MEKISIIVPVYKVERYLRQCLDSIISQTYKNLEIILVDDGSPDNCGAICDEYAASDLRVKVIHKQNGGLCAARNDGIARATGDWIAFVDSDDWCELDYYEQMLGTTDSGKADIIFANGYFIEYSDRCKKVYIFAEPFEVCEKDSLESLTIKTIFPGRSEEVRYGYPWDKLYRKSFLEKQQLLFDTSQKAWEDCWFNFKAFNQAKTIVVGSAAGYHYRQTFGSITRGYDPKKPEIMYNVLFAMNKYVEQHQLSGRLRAALQEIPVVVFANVLHVYFSPENTASYKEVAEVIKNMKERPYYRDSIWNKGNRYLSKTQITLKYALRLPWIWPVKVLYLLKESIGKLKNGENRNEYSICNSRK